MEHKIFALGLLAAALASFPAAAWDDKPSTRLKLIFVERFRLEAWDNAVNLDDTADDNFSYARNRMTLGLRWLAVRNFEVLGKVTNEFRVYLAPKDRAFNRHELFVDNLHVKWTIPGRLPVTVTAGRQDISLGEGFVIADGTPLDGSRSYYFNALRLDADLSANHKLILFAHAQETNDKYLPVINEQPQALVEQPEKALAVYFTGTFGKAKIDAYAVRKLTEETTLWPVAGRIDTFGARAQVPVLRPLSLTAEGAVQTGTYGAAGRSAFGGLAHLDYTPEWSVPCLKTMTLGGIYLSGDDPATAGMDGWDPIFSRWPKWSDGYIYTFSRESRVAYWSNLNSVYGSLLFVFGDRANGTLAVHRLGAEKVRPGEFPGGTGLHRGTLVVGRLNFTISKALSGHFQWDHFQPGDFYAPSASGFNWLRFELMLRY
jgi:hypothetical protein